MAQLKDPKEFEDQLNILHDKYGLNIDPNEPNMLYIKHINYYSIKGYAKFLRLADGDGENFRFHSNITLKTIYEYFVFDNKLKNLFLYVIGFIEKKIRTNVANILCCTTGNSECYFDSSMYYVPDKGIQIFQDEINHQITDHPGDIIIKHHIDNYSGHFPLWVIIEYLSLGNIYYFLKYLDKSWTKLVAQTMYATDETTFLTWIYALKYVRNICSHYNRLIGKQLKFVFLPNILTTEHTTIFSFIKLLKKLNTEPEVWNTFLSELFKLIDSCPFDIKLLGFHDDWQEELK